MSAKAIHEYDGKLLLSYWIPRAAATPTATDGNIAYLPPVRMTHVKFDTSLIGTAGWNAHVDQVLQQVGRENAWLSQGTYVVKPDQLIKRRGKAGLLGINLEWPAVQQWIKEKAGKDQDVGKATGTLHTFLIEPFVRHPQEDEYYICIQSLRQGDEILFTHEGGVDIGDVDTKALRLMVLVDKPFPKDEIKSKLLQHVPAEKQDVLVDFVTRLYATYTDLQFTYLEINPLVVTKSAEGLFVYALDLAAKIDQTAEFECGKKWSQALAAFYPPSLQVNPQFGGPKLDYPAPFGRDMTKEEQYIAELDSKTGASLKLTVLNPNGRVWTMVAGGGASVVYSDAIAGAGFADELANYGEYSGAPSEAQTYEYAKTILDLMTRGEPVGVSPTHPNLKGKVLFIGGGIANFTNVASTFKGIIRALNDYKFQLQRHQVAIYVRRAGPNFQEGLRMIRACGDNLGVPMDVYGPEMHVSGIVPLALLGESKAREMGLMDEYDEIIATRRDSVATDALGQTLPRSGTPRQTLNRSPSPLQRGQTPGAHIPTEAAEVMVKFPANVNGDAKHANSTFHKETRALVYGMQPKAVQGMLDFDYMCNRKQPSVAGMVYPFGGAHVQKFYWGTKETLLPVFTSLEEAVRRYPEVDTIVNFASFRSVYDSTREIMRFSDQIKNIAIIAEGVPEKRARQLLWEAKEKGVLIVGPATVGGIKPGCFKIGNTGGMMDNIVASKLYRPGSVAYVSKSGGMSNELNNIISQVTDGVYEGVAIGGDRYPGSTFVDHMLRYEKDEGAKILMLLGEVGGVEEYEICKAIKEGKITKPVVAWCIGTCADMFKTEVQFGHAGSFANSDLETARAKNNALRAAGVIVPETFEQLPKALTGVYKQLVSKGVIQVAAEPEPPKIPIDYAWAQELGLIRKPTSFISTITDDRGQELLYAGMPITDVFTEELGIGGVLGLLWFKRRLPTTGSKFIEMVLMLTADHGPAGTFWRLHVPLTRCSFGRIEHNCDCSCRKGSYFVVGCWSLDDWSPFRRCLGRCRSRVCPSIRLWPNPCRICGSDAQATQVDSRHRTQNQIAHEPGFAC